MNRPDIASFVMLAYGLICGFFFWWKFHRKRANRNARSWPTIGNNPTDDALYIDMVNEAAKRGLAWQYAQYVARTGHLWPEWKILEEMKKSKEQ